MKSANINKNSALIPERKKSPHTDSSMTNKNNRTFSIAHYYILNLLWSISIHYILYIYFVCIKNFISFKQILTQNSILSHIHSNKLNIFHLTLEKGQQQKNPCPL